MSIKKTLVAGWATIALASAGLMGCGGGAEAPGADAAAQADDKIEVVCATFPAYDWTMQVVGDEAERFDVTYLMSSGVDLHSYQPSVEDVAKIADADVFVYVGGESDGWAQDAVEAAGNPDLRTVNMLEAVGDAAVEEEVVEGMEADEDDHDHKEGEDHDHDEDEEEGPEYDEHVWLSLRNAQTLVRALADQIADADPSNAAAYRQNAEDYCAQLADLDARYAEAVKGAAHDTVVFADRFPFRYLVDDYGLSYYAAFVGCSAETEASFETVAFLAQKLDELGLSHVFVIENSDGQIAQTVVASTKDRDQEVLVLDSLQSKSEEDVAAGATYLGIMEDNLAALQTALA